MINKSKGLRWIGYVQVAHMGVLIRKPEGKLQFGRYRHRWEGNMKIDIKEIG
jgi:hypothetical protein